MISSLALIFLLGLAFAAICKRLRLPGILGMLLVGMILGPCCFNLLDDSILMVSGDLRKIALIIILIKAGLSLDLEDLKRVGRPAIMMSFIPATMEVLAFTLLAPHFFGISRIDAAVMGAVLGAVSPAVVVPRMVKLMEEGYGTKQGIPQIILAGASCDDVFVIVLFSTFLRMSQGGSGATASEILSIPVSIILGIAMGALGGLLLSRFFESAFIRKQMIRNSMKMIIVLGVSFLFVAIEDWLDGILAISGLLAVMAMACILRKKCPASVSSRLSQKFGKLWLAAEVILFVLVGAAVDLRYTMEAGFMAIAMIACALAFRAVGVLICMLGTHLSKKEKGFCVLSYMPKATVQAAIGSVPMAAGLASGSLILSVAVLGILITAPIFSFAMDLTYKKLLKRFDELSAD